MKKHKKEELDDILDTVEKLLVRIISIVGWIKILIEVFKQ